MESEIYSPLYHQSFGFSRFLRIHSYHPGILSGNWYYRFKGRYCAHCYVGIYGSVPAGGGLPAG